jgi:choline kinase
MDADVIFHPAILDALIHSNHGNCFLLDRAYTSGDEPVKIAVAGGTIVEFRKSLASGLVYDTIGESVGFFRFEPACAAALMGRCQEYEAEGRDDAPHEEVLRDLLLAQPQSFGYEDITGLPWVELDFSEDILRAEQQVLPAIHRDLPGY